MSAPSGDLGTELHADKPKDDGNGLGGQQQYLAINNISVQYYHRQCLSICLSVYLHISLSLYIYIYICMYMYSYYVCYDVYYNVYYRY